MLRLHLPYMVISRFEDIEGWQLARELAAEIYGASRIGPFGHQIQRSCVSVMANIAEGFGRNGKAEFIRFLTIAQASCVEVQSHLYIALDLGYVRQSEFDRLYAMGERVRLVIGGFIRYLRGCTIARNEKRETRNEFFDVLPHQVHF